MSQYNAPIKSKFQQFPPPLPPSPGQAPGIWLFSVPEGGEFDLNLGGVGKIKPEVSGFNFFFGRRSR